MFRLQRHVVDHLMGRGDIMNTGRDYLANLAVEQAVYQSDTDGGRVQL